MHFCHRWWRFKGKVIEDDACTTRNAFPARSPPELPRDFRLSQRPDLGVIVSVPTVAWRNTLAAQKHLLGTARLCSEQVV